MFNCRDSSLSLNCPDSSLSLSLSLSLLHRVTVYEYVCYYLLYLVGGRILLNTLAIGVDTVNYLYNTRHRYTTSTAYHIMHMIVEAKSFRPTGLA